MEHYGTIKLLVAMTALVENFDKSVGPLKRVGRKFNKSVVPNKSVKVGKYSQDLIIVRNSRVFACKKP